MTAHRVSAAPLVALVVALGGLAGCTDQSAPPPTSLDSVEATGVETTGPDEVISLGVARAVHRATTLADGRVLLTGGCTTPGCGGVEEAAPSTLFDAGSVTSAPGPVLRQPRLSHTATLLDDGRVLVVGGYPGEGRPPTGSMELFDPDAGSFTTLGSLRVPRADHSASLLPDGRVLVAGGSGADGAALASTEVVDPDTGRVQDAAALPQPRTAQAAATFDGEVLLVGGTAQSDRAVATSVRYDAAGRWSPGPTLDRARVKHAAVSLPGGGLIVIGGSGSAESRDALATTEVLWPGDDRFRPGPHLPEGRYKLTDAAGALPDGRVAVAGGETVAVLDPETGAAQVAASPPLGTARAFQTLSVVSDHLVLVAGGYDADIVPSRGAWLIDVG